MLIAQSCPTLCDPMDYSPPGSSVHGISQARILEWVAILFRGIFPTHWVSCITEGVFTIWATREALKVIKSYVNSRDDHTDKVPKSNWCLPSWRGRKIRRIFKSQIPLCVFPLLSQKEKPRPLGREGIEEMKPATVNNFPEAPKLVRLNPKDLVC